MDACSVPGEGSTCWFTSELVATAAPPDAGAGKEFASLAGKTAPLVDNLELNLRTLDKLLSDGETVFAAVLLDVTRPVMNGFEAAWLMSATRDPTAPSLIALTASALEEDGQRCGEVGVVELF